MKEDGLSGVLGWIDSQRDAMVELLRELVSIDSGTYNKAGVDRVGETIARRLEAVGIQVERIPHEVMGNCVRATVRGAGEGCPPILLLGHCDTVFPDGTAAARPFSISGERAYGPGVSDMKAGLVMNTFLLMAFYRFQVLATPLVGLYTADEEVASPSSRAVIEATAKGALAAFNAEAGRPGGKVVVSRKGSIFIRFRVNGKAAHAGVQPEAGISAIEAICRKVQALHVLTDYAGGMTVNVGIIRGGDTTNTVAPWAEANVDMRFRTLDDREKLMHAVKGIIMECHLPGTTSEIVEEHGFLPFSPSPGNERLYACYRAAASCEGVECEGVTTGGAADSGITASVGVPTICGVGPEGAEFHSPGEYLLIDTVVQRTRIAARTIFEVANGWTA